MGSYYNSMLLGQDRNKCSTVYEQLRGYKIFVTADCGVGPDASCNKRIRYDGNGGINSVRDAFRKVIDRLGLELEFAVNSKGKCEFSVITGVRSKR